VPLRYNALEKHFDPEGPEMMLETIRTWLNDAELTRHQAVLANLAYSQAEQYDEKPSAAGATALLKTITSLQQSLETNAPDFDPLAEMLKR
jgi:hypothetical protein